jgi:hypothetical protein
MKWHPVRLAAALVLVTSLAAILTLPTPILEDHPLWPGARFTEVDRARATRRGLRFICDLARDPAVFRDFGGDLLWCLYSVGATSADPELCRMAWRAGIERTRAYRRLHPELPHGADADEIASLAFGSYAADKLGARDDRIREQIRAAVQRFSPQDFLAFDPRHEPPPSDVPRLCDRCGHQSPRGVHLCQKCGAALTMQSRYDIWYDALITAYTGEQYGVILGAPFAEVMRWASTMRPYPARPGNPEFLNAVYAATHVVYTLDHYSQYRLSPRCLPDEFQFLKASLPEAIALKDPETMGEFLDSLRAFGLTNSDVLIQTGFEYLLRTQNPDGSWGDLTDKDPYNRYHPTWTAIDGLREYRWTKILCPADVGTRPDGL